eukprot:CAMPEP_0115168680 /NCGR_PEP_ID=MMETSP0270-20121206/880_1 /TAXON_ID=71861 /ORGANISM="Scrippsiella trochoidea, Strain CCMP3099" /LENGTH=479 /DNA_ID=CAMNT_0002581359 /DNA_START=42 /DNA_END=1479 /DNA_ORIENTATION=+
MLSPPLADAVNPVTRTLARIASRGIPEIVTVVRLHVVGWQLLLQFWAWVGSAEARTRGRRGVVTGYGGALKDERQTEASVLDASLHEAHDLMLKSIGDEEDAENLFKRYIGHEVDSSHGVLTEAGMCSIRDHVSQCISPSEHPRVFVDLGSGDGVGVVLAAKHWAGFDEYWGVELDPARHRTASRAVEELQICNLELGQKCFLINENILHIPPLLSLKAVFYVSNIAFCEELNRQIGAALDYYAPVGALVLSSVAIPLSRGKPLLEGEIPCPQSWDSAATVHVQRFHGAPLVCRSSFDEALHAAFLRHAEPSEGRGAPAAKVPCAISEALLAIAEPMQIAHLIWHVAGGKCEPSNLDLAAADRAEEISEREELLEMMLEDAELAGLSPEVLRAAYDELERLDEEEVEEVGLATNPRREKWHGGALDATVQDEPSHQGQWLHWDEFESLGRRAQNCLAAENDAAELDEVMLSSVSSVEAP